MRRLHARVFNLLYYQHVKLFVWYYDNLLLLCLHRKDSQVAVFVYAPHRLGCVLYQRGHQTVAVLCRRLFIERRLENLTLLVEYHHSRHVGLRGAVVVLPASV